MQKKTGVTWGIILISFGVLFLVGNFIKHSWPLIVIAAGAAFLLAALLNKAGGLAIPGMISLGLGLILAWQANSQQWSSWYYLWPFVTAAMGAGLVIARLLGTGGKKVALVGWLWFFSGILLAAGTYYWVNFLPGTFSWAWIILGLGLQFVIVSALSAVPGLSIPGVILAVIGAILFWQHRSGDWASWSYIWPLVITGVGLSFMVSYLFGLRSRPLLWVGIYFVAISLLFFFVFGAFFGGSSVLLRFWPALFILVGIVILVAGFRRKDS